MLFIWAAIFLLFFLVEMVFVNLFFCLSIACGAVGGFATAFYAMPIETQIIAFCLITCISFCLLRLMVCKIQSKAGYKTGIEKLKGTVTIMLTESGLMPGTVHVAGTTWNAQAIHGTRIGAEAIVRIIDIKNITLIVELITKNEEKNV